MAIAIRALPFARHGQIFKGVIGRKINFCVGAELGYIDINYSVVNYDKITHHFDPASYLKDICPTFWQIDCLLLDHFATTHVTNLVVFTSMIIDL